MIDAHRYSPIQIPASVLEAAHALKNGVVVERGRRNFVAVPVEAAHYDQRDVVVDLVAMDALVYVHGTDFEAVSSAIEEEQREAWYENSLRYGRSKVGA